MKAKLTFLGTGTSSGVPLVGCGCEVCKSSDPRDKRLRASALVEYGGLTMMVDCGPDFRQQAIRAGITHLDGILLTHNHMDHIGGLDDTRALNLCERHPVNIYCEGYVEETLRKMYAYAFSEPRYPGAPEWRVHTIENKPFSVCSNAADEVLQWERGFGYHHLPADSGAPCSSVEVIPIHGWHVADRSISTMGYRFGNIAYITDMKCIDDCEFEKLQGLDAITANCVKIEPHRSHFSLEECLRFFEKAGARESYITHLSHLLPAHADFAAMLPEGVFPAYDGLVLNY